MMRKTLLSLFGVVFFSAHAWAGAVAPTSTVYTAEVLNGVGVIRQSNVYTFPSSTAVPPVSVANDNVYAIGGGSGSVAANAAKAALGVAAAGAALFSSPVIVGTLVAAQVGMIGYDFYQSLKSNGLTSSSGELLVSTALYNGAHSLSYWESLCTTSHVDAGYGNGFGVFHVIGSVNGYPSYQCQQQNPTYGNWTWLSSNGNPGTVSYSAPGVPSAATNSDIVNAINASTNTTAAAVDAVRLAIQQGVNIPSLLPASLSNSNASVVPAAAVSPEVLVATNTDANGVITRTYQSTSTQLTPPATAGDSAQAIQTTTSKDVFGNNLTPSAVRSTVSTPAVAAPVSTAATPTAAPVNIPTDYNREATQAKIADALGVTPSPTLPSTESADITALTGDSGSIPIMNKSALSGTVTLPSSTNSCVPMDMVIHGIPFKVDPCPLINYLHPLVNYLFIFLFGILNLRTALKNDELAGAA